MELFKHKFTKLQGEIFSLLSIKAGEELNQSGIAKILKVSSTAVAKSLPMLEKENLIIIKKDKSIKLIKVSFKRESKRAVELKRAENLKNIYESGLTDYFENELAGGTIILFGSYSRGEDTANSDIDLAVIGRKDKILKVEDYEKKLGRKININFYSSIKSIHENLKNNILNGIVLQGGVGL
jgi:predicted nucleotidyltransferase